MPAISSRSHYQRRRPPRTHFNNNARRAYDLLRSTLPALGPDAQLVEDDLIASLSASRNTVRMVLQLLAAQGLVSRGPKVGTTVVTSTVLPFNEVLLIPDQGARQEMEGRVLESIVIPAPPIVAERLHLAEGAAVAVIEGLLSEADEPIALSTAYVPSPPDHEGRSCLQNPDPIAFMERHLDVPIVGSRVSVAALASDSQTAALLGLREGAPILFLEDLFHDRDGQPRALSQMRYRGDRVTLAGTAHRGPATESA
jgi:GntR family transcriptional regulator